LINGEYWKVMNPQSGILQINTKKTQRYSILPLFWYHAWGTILFIASITTTSSLCSKSKASNGSRNKTPLGIGVFYYIGHDIHLNFKHFLWKSWQSALFLRWYILGRYP
jgi:hypothetical protein